MKNALQRLRAFLFPATLSGEQEIRKIINGFPPSQNVIGGIRIGCDKCGRYVRDCIC